MSMSVCTSLHVSFYLSLFLHLSFMQLVLQVLVRTFPSMLDLLLVFMTVWLVFSIIGMDLFAGKFYHCFNVTSEELFLPEVVENKSECYSLVMQNYTDTRWKNQKFHFDNVWMGYVMLLRLVSVSTQHAHRK